SEQSQPDQSQSDQSQSDQPQPDQSQSDQSQSDESQSDQSQLAGSRPAEAQPDANQSDAQASTDGDAGAAPATPAPALSDEDRKALAEIVRGLPKLLSAYSYDLGIEGVTVTDPNGGVLGRLAHGGTAFGVKGLDTDKAEASFSLKHDGLDIAGPEAQDPITKALLPRSGNLALVATDIPVPTLADAVAQALPDLTSGDAQGAQGAQYVLMGALMQALSNSTIKLRIDPSEIQTEQTHLTASGAFQLAMQSPEMAVGTADLALTGLDNIAALVAKLPADSPDAGMAKGILQSIRSVSKRATGADGKPVDKFKIELTDKGAATVNGKPLDQVVQ
ncbi:MAG TPA: hypothetical protein VMT54_20270, partial [Candidatus Cybelea sp.]|nr:hypothetical protein [Candidatus Cybelea sp.]